MTINNYSWGSLRGALSRVHLFISRYGPGWTILKNQICETKALNGDNHSCEALLFHLLGYAKRVVLGPIAFSRRHITKFKYQSDKVTIYRFALPAARVPNVARNFAWIWNWSLAHEGSEQKINWLSNVSSGQPDIVTLNIMIHLQSLSHTSMLRAFILRGLCYTQLVPQTISCVWAL